MESWNVGLEVVAPALQNDFTVKTASNGSRTQRFYWGVKAVRSDIRDPDVEIWKKKPGDKDWNLPTVDKARRPDRYAVGAVPAR